MAAQQRHLYRPCSRNPLILMANYKRKKRKTFRYGTCHGGLKCRYDVVRDYCHNTKERRTYRDYKQPQMYNEYGRVV